MTKVHYKRITSSTFGEGLFVVHHVDDDDDVWQHFFGSSYEIAPAKKLSLVIALLKLLQNNDCSVSI